MLSKDTVEKLIPAFGLLRDTAEGQIVMDYLKAVFLYPTQDMKSHLQGVCEGNVPSNDQRLGHMQVVLHIMAMLDQ